jgi:hypothetical protein
MQERKKASWFQFFWRITSCHMVTYLVAGIFASTLLNYKDFFMKTMLSSFMRPIDSPWVAAGPSLQVIRGLLFALILWPIRNTFLEAKKGWLKLWLLLIGLAILGTAGPSPGSLEGIIYTKLPIQYHLWGLPEVIIQTMLFSLAIVYWYKKPIRVWNVLMIIAIILIILMSVAGIFLKNN